MLRVLTGENRVLAGALVREVGAALGENAEALYIVVPKQLTLFTERLLLDGLNLPGSFQLRVLSPARLCALIFDAAGSPEGARVDERGRVMLMRQAIRAARGLTIYRNADRRRGFAERCARQLELFIQGGVSPDALRDCAADSQGATRMKLNDLAAILEQYESLIRGRYQDGDTELIEAERRASSAAFLREGRFWFFGFDIMPPTLNRLIARIAALCPRTVLLFPLPNDTTARDYDCARPLERALPRLLNDCRAAGAPYARECLQAPYAATVRCERAGASPSANCELSAHEAEGTQRSVKACKGRRKVGIECDSSQGDGDDESSAYEAGGVQRSAMAREGRRESGVEGNIFRGDVDDKSSAHEAEGVQRSAMACEDRRAAGARKCEANVAGGYSTGSGDRDAWEGDGGGCREPGGDIAGGRCREACLEALRRELFAYPVEPWSGEAAGVRLVCARDVREECRLAAAEARRLAMSGLRYGEIQLLCADLESYRQPLAEAFAAYQVPLFQEGSRPVSRLATAECLLTALRLLEKNFRAEDVFTLMRCGYMALTADEADRLANYATCWGIEGGRWLRPFKRGGEALVAEMEPLRVKLMAPVRKLRDRLKAADDLKGQLTALFGFLEEINAHGRSVELQQQFITYGMREEAGALSQSWNRIIGALDQMAALMGGEKLSLRELTQALSESLEAAVVKPLPQSGDAVYAQSAGRALMQPARALLILGLSDSGGSSEDGLLTESQRRAVAKRAKAYLGPDEADVARLKRFYLKLALGMASDEVWFSCALSSADGSARRPGMTLQLVRDIFPGLREVSEEERSWLLSCAPGAALSRAARAISDCRAGETPEPGDLTALATLRAVSAKLPREGGRLVRMERMLAGREERQSVDPGCARAIYGELQFQSITRLERFARCPFSYFTAYGLRPERVEPFEFDNRKVGTFLHDAVNAFLSANRDVLNELSGDEAEARMSAIVDELLRDAAVNSPMEDSASVRAESRGLRATACRCARVLTEQMRGSEFRAAALERSFGREDGARQLRVGDTVIEGRIDRMDVWRAGNSLRVIDYKLGGKPLNLAGAYYGLELQLPIYLGAALRMSGARSAGVYYFPLDDGVFNTQTTDPGAVERERHKRLRMTGLLPADDELLKAMTPDVDGVFGVQRTKSGKLSASVTQADDRTFERFVNRALEQARSHIDHIRAGEAEVSPTNFENRKPCDYCDFRAACLFDDSLDRSKVRRLRSIRPNDVLTQLALDDEK